MSNRALVPLIVGLIVGLIAIKLTVDMVKRARAATSNEDLVSAVVAREAIPVGVELKESMLSVAKTSRGLAPKGIFHSVKDLVGRVTKMQIARGVPVIEEMLAPPGTPPGMASLLPPGYRAVAVRVDEFTSVGGFLRPGCRVDVAAVMTVRRRRASPETISKVILQNVLVGAVGQSLTDEGETGANLSRSVTLIVKPEEVPILHLAATRGRIRLALRHYDDASPNRSAVATEAQLIPEPTQSQNAQKGGTKAGLLGGLFKTLLASRKPTGRWAGASQASSQQQAAVSRPFVVTLMQGDAVETIAFASESSMQRLDAKKFRGGMAAFGSRTQSGAAAPRAATPVGAAVGGAGTGPAPGSEEPADSPEPAPDGD